MASTGYDDFEDDEYASFGVAAPGVPSSTTYNGEGGPPRQDYEQDHHHNQENEGGGGSSGGEVEMTAAHNAFVKTLVRKGVMGKLRAQLRSSVVGIIMNNPRMIENNIVPNSSSSGGDEGRSVGSSGRPCNNNKPLPADKQYALAMCVEFLSSMGFNYSLGVLLEESYFAGSASDLINRGFENAEQNEKDEDRLREHSEFERQKAGTSAVTESTWDRAVCQMRRELKVSPSSSGVLESMISRSTSAGDSLSNNSSVGGVSPKLVVNGGRTQHGPTHNSNTASPSASPMSEKSSSPPSVPSPTLISNSSSTLVKKTTTTTALQSATESVFGAVEGGGESSVQSAYTAVMTEQQQQQGKNMVEEVSSVDHSEHSGRADDDDDDQYNDVIEVPMSAPPSPAPKQQQQQQYTSNYDVAPTVTKGGRSSSSTSSSSSSASPPHGNKAEDSEGGDDDYDDDDFDESIEDEDAF